MHSLICSKDMDMIPYYKHTSSDAHPVWDYAMVRWLLLSVLQQCIKHEMYSITHF